jgi:hypothetical protein
LRREKMKRSLLIFCLVAILALPTIGSQAFAQCTNKLTNPGFETGGGSYTGWFTFGSGTQLSLPSTDNIARTGVAAAKVYGQYTGCPSSPAFNVGGFGQAVTPTVGKQYELSGYSYVSSSDMMTGTATCTSNRMIAQIAFFNATSGGSVIARNEVVIGDGNTPLDQWVPFSVSTIAPTGALRVEALFLFLQPACDDGSVFVDDVSFCESTVTPPTNLLANPSFSSGLTGWTTFANVVADSRVFAYRTPIRSAKLYGPFTTPGDVSGMYQSFAAVPGWQWTLSGYALTTCEEDPIDGTNDNYATFKIVFLNSSDVEIGSNEVSVVDNTSPLGTWTHYTVSAVSPPGTVSARAYVLFVQPTTMNGAAWVDDLCLEKMNATGIGGEPKAFVADLLQNVPNPFNPTTTISFTLSKAENAKVEIFDASGQSVRVLFDGTGEAGLNTVSWDGANARGNKVASGAYFYKLTAGTFQDTKKMILLK